MPKETPAKPKPAKLGAEELTHEEQRRRFAETAREAGASEDKASVARRVGENREDEAIANRSLNREQGMSYQRIRQLPPTVEIQLVYGEGKAIRPQQTCRSGNLTEATALARHVLDLEMYLAPLAAPPEPLPEAVRIVDGPNVVWSMTTVEREAEKRQG